jgi:hypothetical protein
MKPAHAAAFALVGWYLMIPPRVSDWPVAYDTNAPLTKWKQGGSFDTAKECDEKRTKSAASMLQASENMPTEKRQKAMQTVVAMLSALQCISTDDPRLKKK